MSLKSLPLGEKQLPDAPSLRRLIGPSFIILGLGLGSGEVILWPYLSSNYGLGIVWGMLIGITMQFFINMEVERYALIYGESIFVGFARVLRWIPIWFILSTFLGFGWPGIGLAGSSLIGNALGIGAPNVIAVALFVVIGLILTLGKVLYKTVEMLQKVLISIGVPFVLLLTLYLTTREDVVALGQGLVGIGDGYYFLPVGISLATFVGALAFAGAGGNLNLAQSCYVRDKGYGMGAYAQKIGSLLTKAGDKPITLTGSTFPLTKQNISRFRRWWKVVNIEHALIFWLLGLITMLTLTLLAYSTSYGAAGNAQGIQFLLNEAMTIGQRTLPAFGIAFLLVAGVMLMATQLTVLDSTSRIMTENVLLLRRGKTFNVSKVYYAILWIQIIFGIAVFSVGFNQPKQLITIGANVNAVAMFVYTALLLYFNNRYIAKPLRPAWWRNLALIFTFLFFGAFCAYTAWVELM